MLKSAVAFKWVLSIATVTMALGGALGLLALGTPFQFSHHRSSVATPSDVTLLDPLLANLSDGRYLRIRVGVELHDRRATDLLKQYKVQLNDALLATLSNHSLTDLQSPQAKIILREEMQRRIEAAVPELAIRSIYFVEFLVHA